MNPQIRILVADNHYLYRDGLRLLIDKIPDLHLVAEVTTGIDAVNFALKHQPDVVLMDIDIAPLNGIKATKEILANNPDCKVLILTDSTNKNNVFDSLQAGATGYLLKAVTHLELQRSIRLVAAGNAVFDSSITGLISDMFSNSISLYPTQQFSELTHRENEVLTYVAKGLRNKQIAAECDIAEKTVRNHVSNILSKLGAATRGEAISRLQQNCSPL